MELKREDTTINTYNAGSAWVYREGVRITHKPTGLSTTCDTERSQHMNLKFAYEALERMVRDYVPPAINSIEDVVKLMVGQPHESMKRAAEFLMRTAVIKDIKDQKFDHVATVGTDGVADFVMVKEGVDLRHYAGQALYSRKSID